MELASYIFPILKTLTIILMLSPAAFPLIRNSTHRCKIVKCALFIYATALLTAVGLTIPLVCWSSSIRAGNTPAGYRRGLFDSVSAHHADRMILRDPVSLDRQT